MRELRRLIQIMMWKQLSLAIGLGLLLPGMLSSTTNALPRTTGSNSSVMVATEPTTAQVTELLRLTNAERQRAGLSPLRLSTSLSRAAQTHAQDLVRSRMFSHQGSDGSQPSDRARSAGYRYASLGENIAAGHATPSATLRQWMNSPGHRSNILKRDFTEVGFGYVSDPSTPYRYYWVQVFGRPL